MNPHLKNLKIISLYKKIIIISLIITLGITYIRIKTNNNRKIDNIVIGKINDIKEKENYTQIELIGKEKLLVTYKAKIEYNLGDLIKIEGKIEKPENNTIPNLFNYKNYLKSKKITHILNAQKIELVKQNTQIKYKIKNNLIKHINKYKTSKYLKTFILGDNSDIDTSIKNTYQENGINHLFSVSGMHLSLFANILLFLLKKLNEKLKYIIIILTFIFFAFLTNYSPSISRALILYILVNLNNILKLNIKTIYLLIIDFIILILYNPFYIYNIGFIFSFTITASLIISSNTINKYKKNISKLLITSAISFITSIPILINNYHEINILTPLNNLIFIPLISVIIFPLSLLTIILKPLDSILLILINLLEQLSTITQKTSIKIILCQIPWYIIILYYLTIIIFIKGIETKQIKKILPLILIITIHTNIKNISPITRITLLDVGQGDSTLLELNNKNILIDTGGIINSKTSLVLNKTIPYLKSLGIKKIDYTILTHGDFDHMGEAINLVNNFKVEKVVFNCGPYNDLEKELIKVLDKKKIKYYSCIKELNIDKNKLYFLQTKKYDNENDNSNVIYTELNGYKFMFMGDASIITEKEIMNKYNLPDIDVLKVGHHGSKTSSSKEFINEINPKYGVISVGKNNRYGHPNKEALDNLKDSKIYRTDQDGSVMFKIKNNKLRIETCSP